MRIARVFPTKTSMSPLDRDAYFGEPDLFVPNYDEIHISVAFTWDKERAGNLAWQWDHIAPVKLGGPAIDGESKDSFDFGKYLRKGITITSRGCPYCCPWCLVKQGLIELNDFPEGNVVQDNNLLACRKNHLDKVFNMLSHQTNVQFSGGLDSRLIDDYIIDRLRGLKIGQLWLSYDEHERLKYLLKVLNKLKKYFSRNQIRCYVLIGYDGDSIKEAEYRLKYAFNIGMLPFAMLYRDEQGNYPQPEMDWRKFQRSWCRPAIIKTRMKETKL